MTTEKSPRTKSPSSGFTQVELAIVLIIGAIVMIAGVRLYQTWWVEGQLTANQARMSAIQQALTNYMNQHNRLPCASSYTAAPAAATYGREISYPATTGCIGAPLGGTIQVTGRAGNKIRIGAVPVRDLGLPDNDRMDVYGNLFTYAVTEALTPAPCPSCVPDISLASVAVVDQNGSDVLPAPTPPQTGSGTAMYVLVGHGKDGKGAYSNNGTMPIACNSKPGLDNDNCSPYASGYFRTAPFSRAAGPTWFDDMIVYDTGLSNTNSAACTTVYSQTIPPGFPSYGTSRGHYYNGSDQGHFVEFGYITFYAYVLWDDFEMYSQPLPSFTGQGPLVDAYCPDASYNVMAGGCTQTLGPPTKSGGSVTNPYGLDINITGSGTGIAKLPTFPGVTIPLSIPFVPPINYSQFVTPPYSHPAIPKADGTQGWECNGSSSGRAGSANRSIFTQAYAVCCPSNGG